MSSETPRAYLNFPVAQFAGLLSWDDAAMEGVVDAAFEILAKVGIQLDSEEYLKKLEQQGARVDWSERRVCFTGKVIAETIQTMRESCPYSPEDLVRKSENDTQGYVLDPSGNFFFDYERWEAVPGSSRILRDLCRFVNGWDKAGGIGTCARRQDVDPALEILDSYALMARWSAKPFYYDCAIEAAHVKYLMEMQAAVEAVRGSSQTMMNLEWPTTPLRLPSRCIDTLLTKFDLGVTDTIGFGTQAMSGATAPATVYGLCAIAIAETLGCNTVMHLLRPQAELITHIATGWLDMRTARGLYWGPQVHLQNIAAADIYRQHLGIDVALQIWYRDANEPGLQACYEYASALTLFQMLVGREGPHVGGLSDGNMFSPEQAVFDAEMHAEFCDLFSGFEVSEDALGIETILDAKSDGDRLLGSDHTIRHLPNALPFGQFFPRGVLAADRHDKDDTQTQQLLDRAHEQYVTAKTAGAAMEPDDKLASELDRIVFAAARELGVEAPTRQDL